VAISRASNSSIQGGLPKFNDIWDGTTATSAFDSLGAVTPSSGTSVITFSNIPQTYTHLQVRAVVATTASETTIGDDSIYMRFNGDTGNNYSFHSLNGGLGAANSTTVIAKASTSASSLNWWYAGAAWQNANSFAGAAVSTYIIDIVDYTNTNKHKVVKTLFGFEANSTSTNSGILLGSGLWFKAGSGVTSDAITTISFTAATYSFTQTTQYALYGVK
jgi:hypothetical protein